MGHAARNDDEAARPDLVLLVTDIEHHPAFDDVCDLFMRVAVWTRLVSGHQAVQRDSRGVAGERLLLDARSDLLPGNTAPVDLMDIHCAFLLLSCAQHTALAN